MQYNVFYYIVYGLLFNINMGSAYAKNTTPLCVFTFPDHRLLHFQSLKDHLSTFESVFYSFSSLATLVMEAILKF